MNMVRVFKVSVWSFTALTSQSWPLILNTPIKETTVKNRGRRCIQCGHTGQRGNNKEVQ